MRETIDNNSHFLRKLPFTIRTREEAMFLKWLICVIIYDLFPVISNEVSRTTSPDEIDDMPCDVGWLNFRQKCFKHGGETDEGKKTWKDAATICTTYGGHLVSINSKVELDFLVNNIITPLKDDTWIGLNDRDLESTFSWQDGSPVNYTNFMIGEPNHRFSDEDCVRMISNDQNFYKDVIGEWRDSGCSESYPYICQKKIVARTVYRNEDSWTTRSDDIDNMPCVTGWHHFRQKCYKVEGTTYEGKRTWQEAANICITYGGHLVSINSKAELHFLVNNIMMPLSDAVWIGLHDRDWESLYTWQDGSLLNYTNYDNDEPNHRFADEDCIRMVANNPDNGEVIGYWRDTGCSKVYPYICQKKLVFTNETWTMTTEPDDVGNMPCDVGWYHFREKCYRIEGLTKTMIKSWHDAVTICTIYGGHLASINSNEELDFLVNNIMMPFKSRVWIGLTDRESKLSWQDGSLVNFTNWMDGQPNNATLNENCVEMLYNLQDIESNITGQWRKYKCSFMHAYICEKKIAPSSVKNESEMLPSNTMNKTIMYTNGVPKTKQSYEVGNMSCDVGWHHFQQKCYKDGGTTHDSLKSWQEAANTCIAYGGHLVSISSEAELDFLLNSILVISKYPVWIGLHDRDLKSMYSWQDGSPVNYTNFMSGEPNNRYPDEDCILMLYNNPNRDDVMGQWKDVKCSLYYSYICQKKIDLSSLTNETQKVENSTSGNLSLEAGITVSIAITIVLVLLGAGIYYFRSYYIIQCFQQRNLPPIPTTSHPDLYIRPIFAEEEENFYEPLDYDYLPQITVHNSTNDNPKQNTERKFSEKEDHSSREQTDLFQHCENQGFESSIDKEISSTQIPINSSVDNHQMHSKEEMNYYEPVDYERINHQRFEQILQNAMSLPQITFDPSTNNIPKQITKRKCNEQDDYNSHELRSFFQHWAKHRFESSVDKGKSSSQIRPNSLITDNHQLPSPQEDMNYYEPVIYELDDTQRSEQMLQNAKSLPQTTFSLSTNNIQNQNSEKEVFEQEDNSYEQMSPFKSSNDKAKSLSQIPTHSSTGNLPMHITKEGYNSYVSMDCFEPESNEHFKTIHENSQCLPQIPVHPSTNDIPKQNSKKGLFKQEEDNAYEHMGLFESICDKTKSLSQIPTNSSKYNRLTQKIPVSDNLYEPMGYVQ